MFAASCGQHEVHCLSESITATIKNIGAESCQRFSCILHRIFGQSGPGPRWPVRRRDASPGLVPRRSTQARDLTLVQCLAEVFRGNQVVVHAHVAFVNWYQRASANRNFPGLLSSKPPLLDIVYDDEMTLSIGGERIELHYFGLGHTRGDTVVYLPDEKVAFMSELYFNGMFVSLGEGYAREHMETLSRQ